MSFSKKVVSAITTLAIAGSLTSYPARAETGQTINIKYYVLKEYNKSAALFEDGNAEPIAVYSTPLTMLNAADAELIREGIRLRGMDEVSRLLEDLDIE